MLIEPNAPPVAPVAVDEVKAFLRLSGCDEDALLAGFIRTATALAEAFTNQRLIARDLSQRVNASSRWQRLLAAPVVAITAVDGAAGALPGGSYETDIDLNGDGWMRCLDPVSIGASVVQALEVDPRGDNWGMGWSLALPPHPPLRLTVHYTAGMAADWNGIPEPLRQGIVRLVSHLHAHRDASDAGGPPAAVAALWRPWRRMRLH